MTSRTKIFSAVILILALIATGVTWGLEQFNYYTLPTRGGVVTTILVATSPAVTDWVEAAAVEFNNGSAQVTIEVIEVDSDQIDGIFNSANENLPDVWIPEAGFVAVQNVSSTYARSGPSVASDSLLWAKPADRPYGLEWNAINESAVNDRQFNIALPTNNNTTAVATCLSAAQTYHQTAALDFSLVNDADFKTWFREIEAAIPNANDPLSQLLSRPPAIDIAMVTDGDLAQLQGNFETADPTFDILFDYPYITRSAWAELSAEEAAAKQVAVDLFFETLIESGNQSALADYGLAPAAAGLEIDSRTIQSLGWCWQ